MRRCFQRVEVFTLDVFNQRHGGCGLIRHIAHEHGHAVQARKPSRAAAALAGDDFVFAGVFAIGEAAHEDRLHDALGFDALGQLIQSAFVHAGARLVLAGHQIIEHQAGGRAGVGRWRGVLHFGAEQGFKAHA
jgi:hypothetical protein